MNKTHNVSRLCSKDRTILLELSIQCASRLIALLIEAPKQYALAQIERRKSNMCLCRSNILATVSLATWSGVALKILAD
jgi:hypothetical protein